MITTTNKSSIIKKLCFVSPFPEERESPCSMDCDSPPREFSSATQCGSPNAPSKYPAQRGIVRNALCVIASNTDAYGDDSLSQTSVSKTCRHQQFSHGEHRNPWNSPDNLEHRNLRANLVPPPPPPPPRRICFASSENFHPTPFLQIESILLHGDNVDALGSPRLPKKRTMYNDKENDTRYLYTTPPSSPRWKKPKLSMKRTPQYTLDGKPCTSSVEGTPTQSIIA